jgi:hypothetical protein
VTAEDLVFATLFATYGVFGFVSGYLTGRDRAHAQGYRAGYLDGASRAGRVAFNYLDPAGDPTEVLASRR